LRFKERREISFRVVSGEANSAPIDTFDEWLCKKLLDLFEEYDEKDILMQTKQGYSSSCFLK